MLQHFHHKQRVLFFGVGLVLAVAGWLFTLKKVAEEQRLASDARIRQLEATLRDSYISTFEKKWQAMLETAQSYAPDSLDSEIHVRNLTERTNCSGVSMRWPSYSTVSTMAPEMLDLLRQQHREKTLTVEAFLAAQKNQTFVEDGRDALALLGKSLLKRFPNSKELKDFLKKKALTFNGPILRPNHRLYLLQGMRGVQEQYLTHLKVICDENVSNYEITRITDQIFLYWTPGALSKLLGVEGAEFVTEATARTTRIPGLQTYCHLQVSLPDDVVKTGPSTHHIVIVSGALMLFIACLALYLSRKDSQLAQLRTELASSMAHELRTPLAGQRILLDNLISGDTMSEEKRQNYLEMIHQENKRLSQLAEEFLTFSRLREGGDMVLRTEKVQPASFLDELTGIFLHHHSELEERFKRDVSPNLPDLSVDKTLLLTALLNLLDNALKYGDPEKGITLSASLSSDRIAFQVVNHGEGISPADQSRIFDTFYRVDQLLTRKRDGIGLGLAIVKRVAAAHGGAISVASTPGQGATFTLSLPVT